MQSGGFLGRLLELLSKNGLPILKNVLKPLAKSVLIPQGLTAAASAADARIQKKKFKRKLGRPLNLAQQTTIVISNKRIRYEKR